MLFFGGTKHGKSSKHNNNNNNNNLYFILFLKSCLKSNIEYIWGEMEKQFDFNFLFDQNFHAPEQIIDVSQMHI